MGRFLNIIVSGLITASSLYAQEKAKIEAIIGDFDGDGKTEKATLVSKTKITFEPTNIRELNLGSVCDTMYVEKDKNKVYLITRDKETKEYWRNEYKGDFWSGRKIKKK